MKLLTKSFKSLCIATSTFIEKYFIAIILCLIFLTYLPYATKISWGDYSGYILQAEAMFNNSTNNFIEKQRFLQSLSINPRYPVYAPVGLPLLIILTSFFTNFNVYLVKLLIPISVFFLSLSLKSKNLNLIILLLVIHPTVTDQYIDVLGEIPALLFFALALKTTSYYVKNILFVITCLIKPTFIIFVFIEILFSSNKKIKDYLLFGIYLFLSELFTRFVFSMQFFGDYSHSNAPDPVKQNLISSFIDNFLNLTYTRFLFFLEEVGIMAIGFSNILNAFFGFLFILFLIFFRNKYSVMSLAFMSFHLFFVGTDYFIRYLVPVLFISFLSLREYLSKHPSNKNLYYSFFVIVLLFFSAQNFYTFLKIDFEQGPHEISALELFEYIESYDNDTIFAFNYPRPFRLFTEKDAYILDGKIYENTVVICYKDQQCLYPKDYQLVFINMHYRVYKK